MLDQITRYLKNCNIGTYITFEETLSENSGASSPIDVIKSSILREILVKKNINALYSHQADAYKEIKAGNNVVITTPTATGKTLCYNIPVLEDIYNKNVSALYFFPIKALGYDQRRQLTEFISNSPLENIVKIEVLDGDTPKQTRRKILENPPDIIISNIDILHYTILSQMDEWGSFLSKLKYIVIDELHIYRGIFGSHVINIFKRFNRFFQDLQIIASSATIGNPAAFAEQLFGKKFININNNGAPRGKKHFLMFNPDISPSTLASSLLKLNLDAGIKTICFTKSRRETETIYAKIVENDPSIKGYISSYRAGFLPDERREIEKKFLNDELKAVVATSAFELGIDIGGVDSTILVGYPGSIINLWQRAGRSGRHLNESLIMLIAGRDALDQYYVKHPELLIGSSYEELTADVENSEINKKHIFCAAFEKSIGTGETYYNTFKKDIEHLIKTNELFLDAIGSKIVTLKKYPYKGVDLRQAGETYTILCNNILLGTNSNRRVYTEMHEGAIYLHRGDAFIVDDIDSTKKEVKVSPVHYSYYTYPSTEKETIIKSTLNEYKDNLIDVKYCELQVTEKFKGYTKISTKTGQKLQEIALEKEPVTFITKGICLTLPEDIIKEIQTIKLNHMGSIHAAEHALIALIPTFILCDRADIGGISYPFHPQINASAIFIYDGYPGGIGLTKRIFEKTKLLIEKTYIQVEGCDCEDGCPACIYSPKCGSGNYPIDKKGSIHLLKSLLIPVNKSAAKQASIPIKNTVKRHSIVFDIETKYGADDVGGWKNADKMGMSVAVAYSLEDNEYLYFEESNMGSFLSLLENARLLVGFNIINFDIKVLSGYGKLNISHIPKLDILLNVKMITGRLFSLDKLASATLKAQKSGNGLQALKWYEEGNMEKLFEYCKHDVELTRDILFFGLKEKFIYAPAGENIIKVFVDWSHFLSE